MKEGVEVGATNYLFPAEENNENGGRRFGQFLGRSGSDRQSRGRSGPVDAPLFFIFFSSLLSSSGCIYLGFHQTVPPCSRHSGRPAAGHLVSVLRRGTSWPLPAPGIEPRGGIFL